MTEIERIKSKILNYEFITESDVEDLLTTIESLQTELEGEQNLVAQLTNGSRVEMLGNLIEVQGQLIESQKEEIEKMRRLLQGFLICDDCESEIEQEDVLVIEKWTKESDGTITHKVII